MNFSTETSNTAVLSLQKSLDVPMMNSRSLSLIQLSYRCIIIILGTLINFLVVVVIRCSRQLHYPRHVFWAAISLVNQCSIIQSLLEIVAFVDANRVACQLYVLTAGVFYTMFLTFLALAALDRYLAITRYEWYKDKATNRNVIYLLSFGGFLTFTTITSPFWSGFKNISNCTVNLNHVHCVMIYDLLLGFLCVILHIMIYIRSRKATLQHPRPNLMETSMALQFLPAPCTNVIIPEAAQIVDNPLQGAETLICATGTGSTLQNQMAECEQNERDTQCFSWFYNRPKISRLEIRAALSMSINVLPVWLCTFPVTLNAIAIYWCIRLELNCPIFFRINPYITDLFLCHFIYNPLMYMSSSTEFKRALIRLKQKLKCNTHS